MAIKVIKALLASHAVDATHLRLDDFRGFMRDRAERLLSLIEQATGKSIARGRVEGEVLAEDQDELLVMMGEKLPVAAD